MPQIKPRNPNAPTPSNAILARHWRLGRQDPSQWAKFQEGVLDVLRSGRFGIARVDALMNHLPDAAASQVRRDVERVAIEAGIAVRSADSAKTGGALARLFGIPVSGGGEIVTKAVKSDEYRKKVADAVISSGYSAASNEVVLLPIPVSLTGLVTLSPGEIHEIAMRMVEAWMTGKDPAKVTTRALERLVAMDGDHFQVAGTEVDAISRLIIGAQLTILPEGVAPDVDSLDALQGEANETTEASIARVGKSRAAWIEEIQTQDEDVFLSLPVAWDRIRQNLLMNHIDLIIAGSLALQGKIHPSQEIDISLRFIGPFLRLKASHDGADLAEFSIPRLAVIDASEDFLWNLSRKYRVRETG